MTFQVIFEIKIICENFKMNLKNKIFSRQGIFLTILILIIDLKLRIIANEYAVDSAIQFLTKSILLSLVFEETTRKSRS